MHVLAPNMISVMKRHMRNKSNFEIPWKHKTKETSDSSLKNSWAAYGPGNSNHLEIILTDLELKDP